MESKHYKPFLLATLTSFLVTASSVALLNFLVDPYGLFSTPRIEGFNAKKPKAALHSRVAKPHQVLRLKPRTLIAGNSRPEVGINPQSKCFASGQQPIYNLGTPGIGMYTQFRTIQHALSTESVDSLLMSLDFMDFLVNKKATVDFATWPVRDKEFESRLIVDRHGEANPAYPFHRASDYLMGLFSLNTFIDSINTWSSQSNINASTIRPDGFNPALDYLDIINFEGQYALFAQKNPQVIASLSQARRGIFQEGTQWSTAFESLLRLLKQARSQDVEVTLFINPYHLDYLAAIDSSGRWNEFDEWKRTLVKLTEQEGGIPLWDFSLANDITTEQPPKKDEVGSALQWFWEPAHYRAETGEIMLAQMFETNCSGIHPNPNIGVKISSKNLESHLEYARQAFKEYKSAAPVDMAVYKTAEKSIIQ